MVDTGFDGSLYANAELAEFLEALRPRKIVDLQAPGHEIKCEVFRIECYIADSDFVPRLKLGRIDAHIPMDVADLSEDVIVGRAILNRLKLLLDGKALQIMEIQ